jgi:hypothetical protein
MKGAVNSEIEGEVLQGKFSNPSNKPCRQQNPARDDADRVLKQSSDSDLRRLAEAAAELSKKVMTMESDVETLTSDAACLLMVAGLQKIEPCTRKVSYSFSHP